MQVLRGWEAIYTQIYYLGVQFRGENPRLQRGLVFFTTVFDQNPFFFPRQEGNQKQILEFQQD